MVIVGTEAYFEERPKSCFIDSLKTLENRWAMSIDLQRNYVKKWTWANPK